MSSFLSLVDFSFFLQLPEAPRALLSCRVLLTLRACHHSEIVEQFPVLRPSVLEKMIDILPTITGAEVIRVALWIIGEVSKHHQSCACVILEAPDLPVTYCDSVVAAVL